MVPAPTQTLAHPGRGKPPLQLRSPKAANASPLFRGILALWRQERNNQSDGSSRDGQNGIAPFRRCSAKQRLSLAMPLAGAFDQLAGELFKFCSLSMRAQTAAQSLLLV